MKNANSKLGKLKGTLIFTSGLFAGALCLASANVMANDITTAITSGTAKVDLRLRAEMVDQDGIDKSATAITTRTRIGYMSGIYQGFSGFFEFENTTAMVDDYAFPNSPNLGKYPVVADPEGTEVNQAYLMVKQGDSLTAIAGRQRIIFDGARFVGNVGWRQNEQTYDAVKLSTNAIAKATVNYAYLDQVNTIFGTEAELSGHLVNGSYAGFGDVKLGAYGYFLDYDSGSDSKTLGLSADGKFKVSDMFTLLYRAEFAQMSDYADEDSGNDASYYNIELGGKVNEVITKIGYEVLGSDGDYEFETPLATKHKFNGWADKFLNTPDDGLVDMYLTVTGMVSGIKLLGTYHVFTSDNGSTDYGKELDLLAAKKFGKNYSAGIKYANYMADDFATDTSKVWLWGGITF